MIQSCLRDRPRYATTPAMGWLLAMGLIFILGGCAGTKSQSAKTPSVSPSISPSPSAPQSDPQSNPRADPQSAPQSVTASPAPDQAADQAPDQATVKIPERIVGLSNTEISAFFGKPQFRRRDAPAEIWQYRGAACTLDLFLYETGKGSLRVHHYEIRHPNTKPVSRRRCLVTLATAHGAKLSS